MLTDLVIENFQSVADAQLRLGRFTVITGPSGSGKSASLRGLGLAAFNHRGAAFIRHGQKTCKAAIGCQDEGWVIGIERSGKSSDCYRVAVQKPGGEPEVRVFTKLAGEAPAEVPVLHRLTELNFAAQFDRPFLLDDSGSQVARMLGELTQVSLVYDAAREAARRKLGIQAELRQAEVEVASLTQQARQYDQLPAQRAALVRAEQALQRIQAAAARRSDLSRLIALYDDGQSRVQAAQVRLAALEPPSLEKIEVLSACRSRLLELLYTLADSENDIEVFGDYVGQLAEQEKLAHKAVHDALVEAGQCPTCGQRVTEFTGLATLLVSGQAKKEA